MDYKTIVLNDLSTEEVKILTGVNSKNILIFNELYKTDIIIRSNEILFYSSDIDSFRIFEKHINSIITLIRGKIEIDENTIRQSYLNIINERDDSWQNKICCFGMNGKPFAYKTYNQYLLSKSIDKNDLVFSLGPAGTGKTFVSVLLAYKYFKEEKVKKIILTRPAVETGESLGFLPGDLQEKVDPYLSPIYDALYLLFGQEQVDNLKAKNAIEIIPLAYMRGRTLNDSFIILDEAQNTTPGQMLMFLSRLGNRSKMIVNGDLTQIDLNTNKTESGLLIASKKLKGVNGIDFIEFKNDDIIRNSLVKLILERFNS